MSELYDCTDETTRSEGIAAAVDAVGRRGCVVLPTDTVYGIGADAFSPQAVAVLLAAKGRGRTMPPPVLMAHPRVLDGLAMDVSEQTRALADAFWPGGLTLIVVAQPSLTWDLGETRGTVALRVPDDEIARALLEQTGPLAVSSANRHAQPAAHTALEARDALGEAVEVYLDGGNRSDSASSTIIDCTVVPPRVVRSGAISIEEIRKVVPEVLDLDDEQPSTDDQGAPHA
ncbi:MAG: L-threonylcarbamoyladenylate synthase [Micrococcaceae bacterium]